MALALSLFCLCSASLSYGGWTSVGPYGGDIFSLAIDPVSPSVVYAATGQGVFKTTDGGIATASEAGGTDENDQNELEE